MTLLKLHHFIRHLKLDVSFSIFYTQTYRYFRRKNMNSTEQCNHYHIMYEDPTSHWLVISVFFCIYFFIFVFGLIGNGLIIYYTTKYKNLQTVQNIFIINLAIADILLCLLSVPLTPGQKINFASLLIKNYPSNFHLK